jgi:hypothetical protein
MLPVFVAVVFERGGALGERRGESEAALAGDKSSSCGGVYQSRMIEQVDCFYF